MTWRTDGSHEAGNETAKIRWDVVPYALGRCLDIGCGPVKVLPHFIGVDDCRDAQLFGVHLKPNLIAEASDLSFLASGQFDTVFSSHTLEHTDDCEKALKEWWRLVKVGGYLVLYLPHKDLYPQCAKEKRKEWERWYDENKAKYVNRDAAAEAFAGTRRAAGVTKIGEVYAGTHWANPDHRHDLAPEDVIAAMKKIGGGFDLIENEVRDGGDEYSFFQVYRKISSGVKESWKQPRPAKTACIIRYGAIGDMAMVTSVLPRLKEQGFHITLYCSPGPGHDLIKTDPHIDRIILQGKDNVPPQVLGDFWDHLRKKYDRFINLSESVEGTFLACPDRIEFYWPNEVRAKLMDRNYLEHAHDLAQVPGPYEPRFYSTKEEKEWARKTAASFGRRNVLWSLAGSSGHKVWPHLDAVIAGLMLKYRDVHVVLVGDDSCEVLQDGWGKEPRVHGLAGKWTIRQSLAFAEVADVVVGTETGLLNAISCMDVPKVINLSHSSPEMLTKHWRNVVALAQPAGVGCPKQPCRQLHGGSGYDPWLDCPHDKETVTALCQHAIEPNMVFEAIVRQLETQRIVEAA